MVLVLDRTFGGAARLEAVGLSDPLEEMVRTILSQNTTDENRDRGYDRLVAAFTDWDAVADADARSVMDAIRPAGLPAQKCEAIQSMLQWVRRERGELSLSFLKEMPVDEAIETLVKLKGVKTATVVLAFAFGSDVCAVDTHVHRIALRTGIVEAGTSRDRAYGQLGALIPKGTARGFHLDLIALGRSACRARNPSCDVCPIRRECDYASSAGSTE